MTDLCWTSASSPGSNTEQPSSFFEVSRLEDLCSCNFSLDERDFTGGIVSSRDSPATWAECSLKFWEKRRQRKELSEVPLEGTGSQCGPFGIGGARATSRGWSAVRTGLTRGDRTRPHSPLSIGSIAGLGHRRWRPAPHRWARVLPIAVISRDLVRSVRKRRRDEAGGNEAGLGIAPRRPPVTSSFRARPSPA